MAQDERLTVDLPLDYPTSLIYVDESGSASNGRVFVVGALKVRRHGRLARSVKEVRDRCGTETEFRFSRINRSSAHHFCELLDTLAQGDVFFGATIIDRQIFNPRDVHRTHWETQADVVARLLRGCINRRELVSVLLDAISTPPGIAFEDEVASRVNRQLRNKSIVTAAMIDSKWSDLLQLVDVLTSAVAFDYRRHVRDQTQLSAHKKKVSDRAKLVLGVADFVGRADRTNVQVLQAPRAKKGLSRAKVVPITKARAG